MIRRSQFAADTSKFYTAWNSVKTLETKDLVVIKGRPARYFLTDEGWEVVKRIKKHMIQVKDDLTTL